MKPLPMEDIRRAVHGHWLSPARPATVRSVSTDTRTAGAGDLFFAIRGDNFDGHIFLAQAAQLGCAGAVVRLDSEPRPELAGKFRGGVIGVPDTIKALGDLAGYYRSKLSATVVAVTGSNGKTTVKRMIGHVLAARLAGVCSPRSFNNRIGVPLTLLSADGGEDYVICELGSSGPGEIEALASIAQPSVAVITNVSQTHLAGLGDLDRVIAEKASVLSRLPSDGLAVVWADNATLVRLAGSYGKRMVTFGLADQADLRLTGWQPTGRAGSQPAGKTGSQSTGKTGPQSAGRGQKFQVNGRGWVYLPLAGKHNAVNALAVIAVAQRFGFSRAEAAEALGDFEGVGMRLEWIDLGGVTVINDAYNANPASVLAAAGVLGDIASPRRVMIVGDMLELGPDAVDIHIDIGRRIAAARVDLLIAVGPLGRYIAQGAAERGSETITFDDVPDAGAAIDQWLKPGDVVLLKASRAVRMERLVDFIKAALT